MDLLFFLISKRGLPFKKKKKKVKTKVGGGCSFLEGQKAGLRFPSEFPPKLMNTSVQYAFLRLKTYVILITIYYMGGFVRNFEFQRGCVGEERNLTRFDSLQW